MSPAVKGPSPFAIPFVSAFVLAVRQWRGVADPISSILAAFGIGGLLSLPWCIVLAVVLWKTGGWLAGHILVYCLIGPMIVCGIWFLIFGTPMLDAVSLSCAISSATVLTMRFAPWKRIQLPSS
jgi:hypothetical protein